MKALAPSRTVAPSGELLSLAGAKAYLRIDTADEDALLADLIAAAVARFDGYSGVIGRALLAQTWAQAFDRFPEGAEFRLPVGKLIELVSVQYYDTAGDIQSFTGCFAVEDAIGPLVVLQQGQSWPSTATRPDAVRATWRCGHATDDPALARIVQAIRMTVAYWHENREAGDLPPGVAAQIGELSAVGL
jgi:uncharacterized phiE125 gp8 family phage protein